MGSPSTPDAPDIPTSGEALQSILSVLAQQLPEVQGIQLADALQNLALFSQVAPSQTIAQLGLQSQFGPLASAVTSENQRQDALNQLFNVAQLSPGLRDVQFAADPTTEATRQTLGGSVLEQLQAGASLDPSLRREVQQATRQGQTARGISFGAAPIAQEALFTGQLANQLRQQRQQAAENLIRLNVGTQPDPFSFAQGGGAQPFAGLQTQVPSGGFGQQFLSSQIGPEQQRQLQQAQLNFNADQLAAQGGFSGAGAVGGALAGASAGSAIFPGPGTIIGALLGAAGGGGLF